MPCIATPPATVAFGVPSLRIISPTDALASRRDALLRPVAR